MNTENGISSFSVCLFLENGSKSPAQYRAEAMKVGILAFHDPQRETFLVSMGLWYRC